MAKVSRGMLKDLVKECLFEILLESTNKETTSSLTEATSRPSKQRPKGRSNKKTASSRPALDSISYSRNNERPPLDTSAITSDPVMAAIFQDTARTTLQEQAAAERGKSITGGDGATIAARESEPSELFGEASQNWAALAFNELPKTQKKTLTTTYLQMSFGGLTWRSKSN